MKKVGKILWKILTNIEDIIASIAIAVMLISICANVMLRYLFRSPTAWADELAIICMAYVTFVGGAAAYKRNLHFGIDILIDRLPAKFQHIFRQVMTGTFMVMFAYLTYLGADFTLSAKKVMVYSGWSYKIIDAALPLGFLSMTIYSLIFFIQSFREPEKFDKRYETTYADDATPAEEGGAQA